MSLRDEFGLPPRRVASAQVHATSDSPLQAAASLDLAWRVVLAAEQRVAEQRKAAIIEHSRPVLGIRARRGAVQEKSVHESPDRPTAAHGSRAILPAPLASGEPHAPPIPARQLLSLRSSRAASNLVHSTVAGEGDAIQSEDCERLSRELRGSALSANGHTARRRKHQSNDCGIAVSGQSIGQRPPTSGSSGWPPDARSDADASPSTVRVLIEADSGERVGISAAPVAAMCPTSGELSELQCQAEREWQAQCAAGPALDFQTEPFSSEQFPTTFSMSDGANRPGLSPWSGRSLLTSEPVSPVPTIATSAETAASSGELWQAHALKMGNAAVAGHFEVLPGSDEQSVHAAVPQPASAGADRSSGGGTSAASARCARRTTINGAHAHVKHAAAAPSSAQEHLSLQRPGVSIRRSRSMPAQRKSAEESGQKTKHGRSSCTRRVAGSHCSMPKSTNAAAAGAGAVAAKKRARASRKLMLPFAYAEDDPRVGHVESADGRVLPEYLP